MNDLLITARWKIHDNKLEEFKKLAEECISIVKEKDHDTHQFDLFFNKEKTEGVFKEKYPDSNALLDHLTNLGGLFGKLLEVAEFSGEIYGDPSEELLNATGGLNLNIYSFYKGAVPLGSVL